MECRQFTDNLQSFLDRKTGELDVSAERHMRRCESCRILYAQMLKLQSAVREVPAQSLSAEAETLLLNRIAQRVPRKERSALESFWQVLAASRRAVRWQRVLITGAVATAGIIMILRLSNPSAPEATDLQAGNDIEILLEEHARAMDSGIFQGTSQYANVITTIEEER